MPTRTPSTTWVLVADAGHAHLYAGDNDNDNDRLTGLASFQSPEGLGSAAREYRDRQSRVMESAGHGRSAAEAHTPPRDVHARQFARELGQHLLGHLDRCACDRLILIAPPRFVHEPARLRELL